MRIMHSAWVREVVQISATHHGEVVGIAREVEIQ